VKEKPEWSLKFCYQAYLILQVYFAYFDLHASSSMGQYDLGFYCREGS